MRYLLPLLLLLVEVVLYGISPEPPVRHNLQEVGKDLTT